MADRLAAAVLPSFYATASHEYRLAAENEGMIERSLRFADRTVRLRFAGARLADALLGALVQRYDDKKGSAQATIELWEEAACRAGSVAFPWRWSDVGPGGLVRGPDTDRLLAVHETCTGALTLINSAEHITLHRVPHIGTVPWWERAAPLRSALFWALAGEGRHLVYAGAVGNDRGGALLVGAPSSGKTTVVMASVSHGLRFVADDYLLLDAHAPCEAISLYNTVSVRPTPDAGEKKVRSMASLFPASLCESLPIKAVIVPRISGGRSRVHRVSAAVALRAWAPSTVFHLPFDDGAVVASMADVVRRVPCFTLDVGDDKARTASAVVQVLEQAAQ